MLRNYFKLSLRHLLKDKLSSSISLLGTTLGFTAFLIIFQYVSFEKSYDSFHENSSEIYRIATIRYAQGEVFSESTSAMPPLRALMEDGLPEIQKVTRIYLDGNSVVEYNHPDGKRIFNEDRAYYADETLFEIFGFTLISGNIQEILDEPREIAISVSTASKYFGDENPVGKILKVTSHISTNYQVTGVFEDPPKNSHFNPDILFSFKTFTEVIRPGWGVEDNLIWNGFRTYVRATNSNAGLLSTRVDKLAHDTWGEQYQARNIDFKFYAQPIQSIHTKSNLEKEFEVNANNSVLNQLLYVALIILVVAWVNYFNLSLTKCVERARQVGLSKVFGASGLNIKIQVWTEALLINITAISLSVLLFYLLQGICQKGLNIYYPTTFTAELVIVLGVLFFGALLSALYPGVFLSRLKLRELIQGRLKSKPRGKYLIKGLMIFQMVATPMLIASAYLIQQQTEHLINQDRGVDTRQVLNVNGPRVGGDNWATDFDRFKFEVEKLSGIKQLSLMSLHPGKNAIWESWFGLYGDSIPAQYMKSSLAEYGFEKVLDLELIAGRTFAREYSDSTSIVINETAARLWGYEPEEIIGRTFWWRFSRITDFDRTVVGVIKDYQQDFNSMDEMPIVYALNRFSRADHQEKHFLIKMNGDNTEIAANIEKIEKLWYNTYPGDPFNYEFLDDFFIGAVGKEQQMLKLIKIFSVLSFALAGLGLFGLSSLIIAQRTREIGIRKVVGASKLNLTNLLSREFFTISLVAYTIAIPLIIFMARSWLENYEIRIDMNSYFFLLPLLGTCLVVTISTVFNALYATNKNPVDSLRHE